MHYLLSDKLKIINSYDGEKSRDEMCKESCDPKSTLCRILKDSDKIQKQCVEEHRSWKRQRAGAHFLELENQVSCVVD